MQRHQTRRQIGETFPAFALETLAHGRVQVPGSELLHLQFRRFAGCPVCNLQLRRFSQAHAQLSAAGVRTLSFFYSSREVMLDYQHELAHPIVPDPERHYFDEFRVERSRWAPANPRAWASAIGGLVTGPTNPFEGGAQDGLPADFLITRAVESEGELRAQIVALHYGCSIDDQWSVEELLELARLHAAPQLGELPSVRAPTGEIGNARTHQ